MKVIDVQPTPNPNAMKFVIAGSFGPAAASFFNIRAANGHERAMELFTLPGVTSVLLVNDFVTINKSAEATWKTLTPAVKKVLAKWGAT
ncbi:MAG TPA: NifU N-terminal domain-containing protein [Tepidisphaeraceae bacterium]|jgi:hypothetical protein